jgi:hypothetical protein
MNIHAAGNVEVPAYLALCKSGYSVSMNRIAGRDQIWIAEKNGNQFQAEGLIELLGVVTMFEVRGEQWQATDSEIEEFLKRY